jgi:hypothetical protein
MLGASLRVDMVSGSKGAVYFLNNLEKVNRFEPKN